MAVITAAQNGDWSNTATWNGGVVPGLGDTVYANGYTVTIDQAIDLTGSTIDQSGSFIAGHIYQIVSVGTTNFALTANAIVPGTNAGTAVAVSNTVGTIFQAVNAGTATTGTARRLGALLNYVNTPISVVTGGGFTMSGNHNITGAYIQAGSANCVTLTGTATSTFAGCRATGSAVNQSTRAILHNSTGTLTLDGIIAIGGRVAGSTAANGAHAIENQSTGTIAFTNASMITGGIGNYSNGLLNSSTGTITATSSTLSGGSGIASHSINNSSTGTITVASSSISGGGDSAFGINNLLSGTITVVSSTITGGNTSFAYCIENSSTGTITTTNSTVTAGGASNSLGIRNGGTGTITCTGDITATNAANGLQARNSAGTVKVSGSLTSSANGTAAIDAIKYLIDPTPTQARFRQAKDGVSTYTDFFTSDNNLNQAAIADVRSGVVYANGTLTGTCAVPAAGSVALGVPVDNTVGTAVITAAGVRSAVGLASANLDAQFQAINVDFTPILNRLPAALVSGRIDASVGAMAANTLTASALASDAVAEIQSGSLDAAGVRAAVGLAGANLDTQLSGIKAKTDLITTGTVFVTVDRVAGSTITMHYNEATTATVALDEDTSSLTLRFIVENSDQLDVLVIENASITRTASNFTVTITTAVTATLGQYRWALRDITGGVNRLIEGGVLQVISAANKDA
jgi:hypothetical protein